MNRFARQIESQMQRTNVWTQGVGRVSWDEESGMDIYTLPNVKQIARGKQPHRTGGLAQCFVTTQRGGIERVGGRHKMEEVWGYMYIYIANSLCYKAETKTPL